MRMYRNQHKLFKIMDKIPFLRGFSAIIRDQNLTITNINKRLIKIESESLLLKEFYKIQSTSQKQSTRNVLFLNNSYYHFYYLSKALRRRGWDTLLVSTESTDSTWNKYYHGEDINLYDPDAETFHDKINFFTEYTFPRFSFLHFAGMGLMSFYPKYYGFSELSPDMISWKNAGKKIAYTISGCNDGIPKDVVAKWSLLGGKNVCQSCVWDEQPDVCNPQRSAAWGTLITGNCDIIFAELLSVAGAMLQANVIFDPVTACLDEEFWRPDLNVPQSMLYPRKEGEIIIYHGMGEYESRSKGSRNIKGTPSILAAVERLQSEGYSVRLEFASGIKSTEVRFLQVQADIIVDQLNMGRYGAQAREGMMLGKPVICYINPHEIPPSTPPACLKECPLVSATEATVYEKLKWLLDHPIERKEIGEESRRYAIKWHSADQCAIRYEKIYDAMMAGNPIQKPIL